MLIVLLTDFGTSDYFVAAMKGAILTVNPTAMIHDLTHEIPPQDIRAAAFILEACYRDFPPDTVFACVVDPGVGGQRKAIVVEAAERFFVAPDNGLLGLILQNQRSPKVFELSNRKYQRRQLSGTFHGRDIFAPAAAHISLGVRPE